MSRLVSATLISSFLWLSVATISNLSSAKTCTSMCKSHIIQFKPGQYLHLQVLNRTLIPIKLEKLPERKQFTLLPGKEWQIVDHTSPENLSLMFWTDRGNPIEAIASKPNLQTLRLEIRASRESPGEHSLYLLDDGRVDLF